MKTTAYMLRALLAAVLTASAACGGSGGGGRGDVPAPTPVRPGPAEGVRPTENDQTRAARQALDLALAAATPAAATPHYQRALDSANAAIALDATNPLGHRLAGEALMALGRPLAAAQALDEAERLRPVYVLETEGIRERGWIEQYQRAEPLINAGKYREAADVLEGANALYRARPEIMVVLGQIYAQENQPRRALPHLERADSLIRARLSDVDSTMAAEWRAQQVEIPAAIAQAYLAEKRYAEAVAKLAELAAANRDHPAYVRSLAHVYAQSQKPDSAAAVYARLLARPELPPDELYKIGVGLYQIDRFAEAARAFGRVAQASPKDRDAFEMWARALQLAQTRGGGGANDAQIAELLRAAEGWVRLDPYSRVGMLILAQTAKKANDEARTREIVRQLDALTVAVTDLELRRMPGGGATLIGALANHRARSGAPATLTFTFFDRTGNALGSETVRVTTAGRDARSSFSVDFESDRTVEGYTYELAM